MKKLLIVLMMCLGFIQGMSQDHIFIKLNSNREKIFQRGVVWNIDSIIIDDNHRKITFRAFSKIQAANFILDCYRQNSDLKFDFYIGNKRFQLIEGELKRWLIRYNE